MIKPVRQIDFWQSNGHMAALYQNELYEFMEGQTARRMLMRFGVLFGTKRIVIYVEPNGTNGTVTSNTARNQLRIDSERLPWDDWAEEFRDNMPEEIQQMMDEILAGSTAQDHRTAIRERLKSILHLFRLSRYKRVPEGQLFTRGAGGSDGLQSRAKRTQSTLRSPKNNVSARSRTLRSWTRSSRGRGRLAAPLT